MRLAGLTMALVTAAGLATAVPAAAGTVPFFGSRTNISPGGSPSGRCAPAITVSFAPGGFAASGTSNLGDFSYVASQCIAGPPPGNYFDGQFEWTFGDGTLTGTYTGTIAATATPGTFGITESLVFTGGTGKFLDATGFANVIGSVRFGPFGDGMASFGDVRFDGQLHAPAVPEPATVGLLAAGLLAVATRRRRRDVAAA